MHTTSIISLLSLGATLVAAAPRIDQAHHVRAPLYPRQNSTATLDLGKCTDPGIVFGAGFDGRKEDSFQPRDKTEFNHGSALNVGVITGFIADRLNDECAAPADTVSAARAAASSVSTLKGQAAADAWNSALGLSTGGSAAGSAAGPAAASSGVAAATTAAAASTSVASAVTAVNASSTTSTKSCKKSNAAGSSASGSSGTGSSSSGSSSSSGAGSAGSSGSTASGSSSSSSSGSSTGSTTGSSGSSQAGSGSTLGAQGSNSAAQSCDSKLQLLAANVQSADLNDGQVNGSIAEGQSAALEDPANFINFCTGKTLTNGTQNTNGSCNGITMGDIPSADNMISTMLVSPLPGSMSNLKANTTFNITAQVNNLVAGSFTNAASTYYKAPQVLQGGNVVGHTHVSVQALGDNIATTQPPDAKKFVFFKGINDAGNGDGLLSAVVEGGLPAGAYRVCTMTSSSTHQPVLMPVAQRGPQDDCNKFIVS